MAGMNFNTANQTFRQLSGNGLTYRVPPFQRDYSWTADEWDDLWQDILGLFEDDGEPAHYMGYLVLQSTDNKQFDIIDGQQRITTLSILILAGLSYLNTLSERGGEDGEKNRKRMEQLRNSYIGYLDPVTLISRSKLELNRHNDSFYQNYLVPLERIPQRGLNASEHLLRKAFNWFSERIKTEATDSGEKVASLIDSIVDKLFFTVITVSDELNAYKVFETLNARGVRLSSTDLLKNYLFSVVNNENVHETELKNLEDRWEAIVGTLGSETFPEFLRVFWNSRNKLVRKSDLFKTIRKEIRSKEDAFSLIRNLDENARIYAALRNPHEESWTADERLYLVQLQMFNVRQPLPLLLSAYCKYSDSNRDMFDKILRSISIISFRYNVICGLQTNEQERVYNDTSVKLSGNEFSTERDVLLSLKKVYPEDAAFKAAFAEKGLRTTNSRNKKVVRYILFELEKYISGTDYEIDSGRYDIEHILPEHPEEEWTNYDEHQHEKYIYRLGNMTILKADDNRELGNSVYPVKVERYRNSSFKITQSIADEFNDWTVSEIDQRQNKMARQASSIWRIDF